MQSFYQYVHITNNLYSLVPHLQGLPKTLCSVATSKMSPVCAKGVHARSQTVDMQPLRKTKVRGEKLVGGISTADVKHTAGLLCFIALLKRRRMLFVHENCRTCAHSKPIMGTDKGLCKTIPISALPLI